MEENALAPYRGGYGRNIHIINMPLPIREGKINMVFFSFQLSHVI